jgi:hypothetical protein
MQYTHGEMRIAQKVWSGTLRGRVEVGGPW